MNIRYYELAAFDISYITNEGGRDNLSIESRVFAELGRLAYEIVTLILQTPELPYTDSLLASGYKIRKAREPIELLWYLL